MFRPRPLARTLLVIAPVVFAAAPAVADIGIVAAMQAATDRFAGRVVAAELTSARPGERTEEVYELRLLTTAGDILRIRVDAENGDILDVDGRGLMSARRPPQDQDQDQD